MTGMIGYSLARRCRSSVVEHPLGKGEVECSIHSGSTKKITTNKGFFARALPSLPSNQREQSGFPPRRVGENQGTLFSRRSSLPNRRGVGEEARTTPSCDPASPTTGPVHTSAAIVAELSGTDLRSPRVPQSHLNLAKLGAHGQHRPRVSMKISILAVYPGRSRISGRVDNGLHAFGIRLADGQNTLAQIADRWRVAWQVRNRTGSSCDGTTGGAE